MAEIGKYNTLKVVKTVDFGVYLDGGKLGEILLPKRYCPETCEPEQEIEVFIYLDSDDRLIATTLQPLATVDEFAFLKVVDTTMVGAFLDWGLPKDLLVPYREQKGEMQKGNSYVVYVYFDKESERLAASAKLDKFLDNLPVEYEIGQKVELLIAGETDLGYRAIIEDAHWGMLYANEIFKPVQTGQRVFGYIKNIREDEKIDLSLYQQGYGQVDDFTSTIMEYLKAHNGKMLLHDKSPAEEISKVFGVSKKTFKKAVGSLYKQKKIALKDGHIELL